MTERPPYRAAALAGLAVLIGYLVTLAPSVTFWDAGEFIAAAKTLGIPHPPGTPLFVLLAHVWGLLVPFGEYAWRLNLLSAVCGAVAAGCWFLVAHATAIRHGADLEERPRRVFALATGAAAALLAGFTFTNWQNAVETEVYAVAMLTIALVAWLATRWRSERESARASRFLLVLLYLGAISIGNHLLALLAGPALVALLLAEGWGRPLADPAARGAERARIMMVAATWAMLIALGLGSTLLTLGTGALALVAAGVALKRRQIAFTLVALLIVVIGISPYLFLFLRAQQGPWLNEADPSTWDALLAVIRRAQFPIRTPFDDPTQLHGPDNPGRSLVHLGYQFANYFQYFDWQWARGLGTILPSIPRLAVTLLFAYLGLRGAEVQRRSDRSGFWFMLALVGVTGIGLVLYMNFKPGPSVGWERWATMDAHEVRERDYFFVASFVGWAVWAAIGLGDLIRTRMARTAPARRTAWLALFAVALLPAVLNARAATRRQTAEATLARDFAWNLLQSVPPGGILFTWGDNDTFPLWYAQAVEGMRRDVTVVCLALSETPWYMRQVRGMRPTAVDRSQLAAVWAGMPEPDATLPIHTMPDSLIDAFRPFYVQRAMQVPLPNGITVELPRGSVVMGKDLVVLQVLQANAGRRPVAWSTTAASRLFNLAPWLVQTGLAHTMPIVEPDTTQLAGGEAAGPGGVPIQVAASRRLMMETWRYGRMLDLDVERLDPNIRAMARTMAVPLAQVGVALVSTGDTAGAVPLLQRSVKLFDDARLRQFLVQVGTGGVFAPR